jgi:hypothetical protein
MWIHYIETNHVNKEQWIDLPEMRVVLEDLLIGQFLMEQVVAVVQVLRNLAVELLYLVDRLRVNVALVELKVLLEADCQENHKSIFKR